MKCDRIIAEYLNYENFCHIPFILKLHILFCRKCRREISGLSMVFSSLKKDSSYRLQYDITTSVMEIIRRESGFSPKTISGIKWVAIGSIIFISIFLINFSDSFVWMKKEFGSNYTLPMSIVLGSVLTAYSSIVVGCNYERIKKYLLIHLKLKLK